MALISSEDIKEGEIFCKWLENRMIHNNKNVLTAELGATGSGKSWRDLRKAELWYRKHFNEDFPAENICFGIGHAISRLASGKLRKGEIIIFEEAGVNLGSLDFQNKIVKMMTYVLQSFRSMNVAIFFNLPYLSMLTKQARMLLHYSAESAGVDSGKGLNLCKPFVHQVNQGTGKIYKKYFRIRINGKVKTMKRMSFSKPSDYLTKAYEEKKAKYLQDLTKGYDNEIKKMSGHVEKVDYPTEQEFEAYYLHTKVGLTQDEIAKRMGKTQKTISNYTVRVKNYLKSNKFRENKSTVQEIESKTII